LNSHEVDIRADIYSLGATFYYLLAGHNPFQEGPTLQKLFWQHVRQPKPIRELRQDVPEGLAAVIERMMAKEPAERYQTPAEVAEALAAWAQTSIPPPPAAEMPGLAQLASGVTPPDFSPRLPASLYQSSASPVNAQEQRDETSLSLDDPAAPDSLMDVQVETDGSSVRGAGGRGEARETISPRPLSPPPGETEEASNESPSRPRRFATAAPPKAEGSPRAPWRKGSRGRALLLGAASVLLLAFLGGGIALYKMLSPAIQEQSSQPKRPATGGTQPAAPLRLLVPAYFYPAGEGLASWERLIDSPVAASTVVVVNPQSGPGKVVDPNYAKVLERARHNGVTVIGYVSTKYAARLLQQVKGEVDLWTQLYPTIQGIFFDEQPSAADQVRYYAALYEYVRKVRGLSLVVTNPGTVCAEEYLALPAADVVCLVEVVKDFSAYRPPDWTERYPEERFAALLCQTENAAQMKEDLRQMRPKRLGYCYITDGKQPNPWGGLPSYWGEEVESVQQFGAP
jgi:hypothetical protein